MRRQSKFNLIIAIIIYTFSSNTFSAWKNLKPGIDYQDLSPPFINDWSHLHVFKINLNTYRLKIINHEALKLKYPSIENYAKYAKSPLAFNGGFFDMDNHALGLRISNFKTTNHFKKISWWGVFSIKNKQAIIQSSWNFKPSSNIEFAMQSGPRLIVDHHIPHLRPGYAERTAICIISKDEIAIVISQFFPMTLKQLAHILQAPPLHCSDAINLDGGSSSQFFAKFPKLFLHMPGLASVSDAIVVESRPI